MSYSNQFRVKRGPVISQILFYKVDPESVSKFMTFFSEEYSNLIYEDSCIFEVNSTILDSVIDILEFKQFSDISDL